MADMTCVESIAPVLKRRVGDRRLRSTGEWQNEPAEKCVQILTFTLMSSYAERVARLVIDWSPVV